MSKFSVARRSRFEQPTITRHFLALGYDDRRLRFGVGQTDCAVRAYVDGIDFAQDALLGVLDVDSRLLGVAHLARSDDHAELGISVLVASRNRGIGAALLQRAHTQARDWGVRALLVHCLTENGAMTHLARSEGMDVIAEAGEADAWLRLPPAESSGVPRSRSVGPEPRAIVRRPSQNEGVETRPLREANLSHPARRPEEA